MIKKLLPLENLRNTHPLFKIINGVIIDLPTPVNISNFWNFGSCLGACLGLQLVTGLLLASHYNSSPSIAFDSVNHIIQDVGFGWIFRIAHLNGASFFFIFLFLHISRGLYYKSFKYLETWNIGVVIFFLSIATAFLGYVLPWGQIRFWGATVITNLVSAIPILGKHIVTWLWGGFRVNSPTLSRFFILHFIMPFIISALVIIHIFFLHKTGSQNPTNLLSKYNLISFHWFFTAKDLAFILIWVIIFEMLVFLNPFLLGDPENFILANPIRTPAHIVPEWYFLFAYAILRSIPDKLGGVLALLASVLILFLPSLIPHRIPFKRKGSSFTPFKQFFTFCFLGTFIILTWIGGEVVEDPFITLGQVFLVLYFFLFLSFSIFFFILFKNISLWLKRNKKILSR